MRLSSLKRPMNMYSAKYGDRRDLAGHCRFMWLRYFDTIVQGEFPCDVAVWELGPRVSLRPASTFLNESAKDFVRPWPIYFELTGFAAERSRIERQKNGDKDALAKQLADYDKDLFRQMQRAILEGFEFGIVVKKYKSFQSHPFTVVVTRKDAGLQGSEFRLVWKNPKGPSLAAIARPPAGKKAKVSATEAPAMSVQERHLAELKARDKQWWADARKRQAKRETAADKRKPALRQAVLASLDASKRRFEKLSAKPSSGKSTKGGGWLLSLDDGNQFERRLAPKLTLDQLVDVVARYQWSRFELSDNLLWEYANLFLNPAVQGARTTKLDSLWKKLNRPQKVGYAVRQFIGEVDNGGVWQFLFNEPQLAVGTLEALREIGASQLADDYQATLAELLGKAKTIADIRKRAASLKLNTDAGWQAFAEGYKELPSARSIEKYFYRKSFKRKLFQQACEYMESQLHLLVQVDE